MSNRKLYSSKVLVLAGSELASNQGSLARSGRRVRARETGVLAAPAKSETRHGRSGSVQQGGRGVFRQPWTGGHRGEPAFCSSVGGENASAGRADNAAVAGGQSHEEPRSVITPPAGRMARTC